MKKNTYDIAIVGATGIVGHTLLALLAERHFPLRNIYLLASDRSAGDIIPYAGTAYTVRRVDEFDFSQTQLCFFCASNEISAEFAPRAAALGNWIIDKSAWFRNDVDVPLVVPEVNAAALAQAHKKMIASPNCSTIPIAMVLKPLHDAAHIKRIQIATYQSVSGSGKAALTELSQQSIQILNGQSVMPSVYPQQIAFNVLAQIDAFEENGYTREEMKLLREIHKIFNDETIAISATAVRVPVFYGHAAAVSIETSQPLSVSQAQRMLSQMPGVKLFADAGDFPSPVRDAAGQDHVCVGRVRQDISHSHGLCLWVVADNIRKGAALNAVHIAETLIKQGKI